MIIKIRKQKLIKIGNSYYVGIPIRYITDEYIDPTATYDINMIAADEDTNNE